jgi:8-oxo-dGTP pyrophosphatase MutT (NUDIX family)
MSEYVRRLRDLVGGEELLQVPSVSVALRDEEGRVLLARHAEIGRWLFPGGAIEPGEIPADAALREMWEETGLVVALTRLVGVFGGPDVIIHYRNGHRTSYVMAVFEARPVGGRWAPDGSEVLEMRFVSEAEVAALPTARWVPEVVRAVFHGQAAGAFQAPTWQAPSGA